LSTSFGWDKGRNVTSAGWQVTLCDPMSHVSSRSGVATLRTAIHLLLTYLLTYLLKQHIKSQSTRLCSAFYGGCKRDTARICCCAACALLLGARRLLRCAAQQSIDIQWCIAKNGGGYTQTGVAKGLEVPCLFMITDVSIRCQKKPRRLVYAVYPRIPPPIHHCRYRLPAGRPTANPPLPLLLLRSQKGLRNGQTDGWTPYRYTDLSCRILWEQCQ